MKRLAWLMVVVPMVVAGCGSPWVIVRQGNPNPLTPATQFAIDNTTFSQLEVGKKTEGDYLAGKTAEQQQSFQNDKMAFTGGFSTGMQGQRGTLDIAAADQLAGRFVVHSNVTFLEPGNFNGFYNLATQMRTHVVITDPSNAPIDEIEIRCVVGADLYHPSVGVRVTECGRLTGKYAARYLRQRVGIK